MGGRERSGLKEKEDSYMRKEEVGKRRMWRKVEKWKKIERK